MWVYKHFLLAWLMLAASCAFAQEFKTANKPLVDKLLVIKSERRLDLLHKGEVLKSYRISLGRQPIGAKQREGDQRTPEGIYFIDWRQKSANFNLSLHISYPNQRDRERAAKDGVDPGGMIMIHGTPVSPKFPDWFFRGLDWTQGCIALTNDDMLEVWQQVADNTLIEIRP